MKLCRAHHHINTRFSRLFYSVTIKLLIYSILVTSTTITSAFRSLSSKLRCSEFDGYGASDCSVCSLQTTINNVPGRIHVSHVGPSESNCEESLAANLYFRLYDGDGVFIGSNEETCGTCALSTFDVPSLTRNYHLHYHCCPGTQCGGSFVVEIATIAKNNSNVSVANRYATATTSVGDASRHSAVDMAVLQTDNDNDDTNADNRPALVLQLIALNELYLATNGSAWTRNSNWNKLPNYFTDTSRSKSVLTYISDLSGVYAGRNGVVGIRLDDNNLCGTLPSSLMHLTALKYLELRQNSISGTIPSEISYMSLNSLDLSWNVLEGTISTSLLEFDNLYYLALNNNQLSGTLPLVLNIYSVELAELYLHSNNLTGSIPAQYCEWGAIQFIYLSDNQFTCFDECYTLFTDLFTIDFDSELDVCSKNLTMLSANLTRQLNVLIDLYNATDGPNWYRNDKWDLLPSIASSNYTNDTITYALEGMYGVLFSSEGVTRLQLHMNNLHGTLPASISDLTTLQVLALYSNFLTGTIPTELGLLTSLLVLDCYRNPLEGTLPTELGLLSNLVLLYFTHNFIEGTIPTEYAGMSAIRDLSVFATMVTGTIPLQVSSLSALKRFNIRGNYLHGTLPLDILTIPTLKHLFLHDNYFSGYLPNFASIALNGLKLQFLSIMSNFLTGSISSFYCDLPDLQVLLAANNRFHCYSLCSSENDYFADIKLSNEYDTCSGLIDESLCAVNAEMDILSRIPAETIAPIAVSVPTRVIHCEDCTNFTVLHVDQYLYSSESAIKYEFRLDEQASKSSKINYYTGFLYETYNYYRMIVGIGESSDGLVFDYEYYCADCTAVSEIMLDEDTILRISKPYFPGQDGAASFVSTLPYVSVIVYYVNDRWVNGNLTLYGYSFSMEQTLSMMSKRWHCTDATEHTTNPCEWYGVGCDNNMLTSLKLPYLGLSDALSSDLGLLSTLTVLDLSHNALTGTLSTSLALLRKLITIDLSDNNLEGELPAALSGWSRAREVSLASNSFSGSFPEFLGSLTALEALDLGVNSFRGQVPASLCTWSDVMVNLEKNQFGCYQMCDGSALSESSIQYGDLMICSPTSAPTLRGETGAAERSLSSLGIGLSVAGAVLFVVVCAGGWWTWRKHVKQSRYYAGYPIHEAIAKGRALSGESVKANLGSARKLLNNQTAVELLLEKLSTGAYIVEESVLYLLVSTSMNLDPMHAGTRSGKEGVDLEEAGAESYSAWSALVQSSHNMAIRVAERVLAENSDRAEELAFCKDGLGRCCKDIASPQIKEAIVLSLMLFRKFELRPGVPAHKSETSLIRFALMHSSNADGSHSEVSVALKFMKHRQQFLAELECRERNGLSGEYVIGVLESYDGDSTEGRDVSFWASARTKGYEAYQYCLVMPMAESSLQSVILQQHIAGHDWDAIRVLTKSLSSCLAHLHSRGVVHGDLKPLNVVSDKSGVKLIDFDASVRFRSIGDAGDNSSCMGKAGAGRGLLGAKYSSAYLPPEMFFTRSDDSIVVRSFEKHPSSGEPMNVTEEEIVREGRCPDAASNRTEGGDDTNRQPCCDDVVGVRYQHSAGYDLVLASPSHDMWSLGAILYLLCTGETLFQASVEDNISSSDMQDACTWSEAVKAAKLSRVTDRYARNLLSLLLEAEPSKRLPAERVLEHPFVTGKQPQRLVGERAKFDVFISYRAASDRALAQALFERLRALELVVWLDKHCLPPGQPWEEGFCDGLVSSACFVCLLSRGAINHASKPAQNLSQLTADSRCDNVLLEWRLALELRERGLIDGIFPVLVGDFQEDKQSYTNYFPSGCHPSSLPQVSVAALESKVREHLSRQGLGAPFEHSQTVKGIVDAVVANQGEFLRGQREEALGIICDRVVTMVRQVQQKQNRLVSIQARLRKSYSSLFCEVEALQELLNHRKSDEK